MDPQRRQTIVRAAALAAPAVLGAALLQRRHLQQIANDPEQSRLRDPARGRTATVRSADGTELHVEVFGAEDGEPVVLAHGWTETLQFWTYVIDDLVEHGFRVIAFDHRGHGQSGSGAGDDYAIERFGEDLEAVLTATLRDGERALIAGHSLGAMAIVAWAAEHDVAARARALALVNTGVGELVAETLLIPVPALAQLLNRTVGGAVFLRSRAPVPKFSTPLSHAILRYAVFGPAASPAQIAFYERMLVGSPPDARADIGIALSELDLREALPRLTVPTLVIGGDRDRLTPPAHAERIAAELPDLHGLVVLERTGHMSPLERPHAVSKALLDLAGAAAPAFAA